MEAGTVTTIFPTGHAIGLTLDDGRELLIHVGMDTVQLEGRYFTAHVAQGDKVTAGQLLIEFEPEKIRAAGFKTITPDNLKLKGIDFYHRYEEDLKLMAEMGFTGTLQRYPKQSFYWYKDVIATNGACL